MDLVILTVMLCVFAVTSRGIIKLLVAGSVKNVIEKQKDSLNKLIEEYNEDSDKVAFGYWCVWFCLLLFRVSLLILTVVYFLSLI